ncbi:MAG TPA: RNA polymerase sigma factor [Puia sp.]|nr:RNA polymerase sigma factor [Puia sp.]
MSNKFLHNERELLVQVAGGNEQAFRLVCEHYSPLLYTTIFRFTNEQWVADEVVQDILLKLWLKKEGLTEIDNFKGWLYTVASNLTVNVLKKIRQEKNNVDHWLHIASYDNTSVDAFSKENEVYWEILKAAIDRLPPKQRDTFRLIKEQNMKRGDAAKILQVSPETVKWNLEQALRSIRAYCVSRIDNMSVLIVFLLIGK